MEFNFATGFGMFNDTIDKIKEYGADDNTAISLASDIIFDIVMNRLGLEPSEDHDEDMALALMSIM